MPTVLLVEDEPGIRGIVRAYLEADGFTVREAISGTLALADARAQMPDLVVLDLMLPDLAGEDVCAELRRISRVPVIMLTGKSAVADRLHGLSLGADDYLVKPFSPRELVARAHAVLRRSASTWDDPADVTVALNGRLHLHRSARTAQLDGVDLDLTDTEQRILRALARRPAKVWSRGELLCLGDRGDGEERTVDVHVRNLRRKLDAARAGASDLVATVHGAGYRFNATALEDA
jgi:DNA-binding response OmpR family regulator